MNGCMKIGRPAACGAPRAFFAGMAALLLVIAGAGEAPAFSAEVESLPQQEFSESVLDSLETSLEIYEEVRAELAADRLQGVSVDAMRLAGALRMALMGGAELPAVTQDVIDQAADGAELLAEAEDLDAARIAFGEVSRGLVLLGGADSRLTEDWHVFACPMAKGYPRWVQPMEEMANPYMGPSMLQCGVASDWPEAAPAEAGEALAADSGTRAPAAEARARDEPEFKPGIPGLTMVDVRDQKFLWREIEQLQMWERGDRITIAEFRNKSIEKTAHYLGFGGEEADEFIAVASEAVASIRDAFHRERKAGLDPSGLEATFTSTLDQAVARVSALFEGEPRHQLFEPDVKKWLLKLAFGPRERDEAKETGTPTKSAP